jgi:hypothetical protein
MMCVQLKDFYTLTKRKRWDRRKQSESTFWIILSMHPIQLLWILSSSYSTYIVPSFFHILHPLKFPTTTLYLFLFMKPIIKNIVMKKVMYYQPTICNGSSAKKYLHTIKIDLKKVRNEILQPNRVKQNQS